MLKRIKKLLERNLITIASAISVLIAYLSLAKIKLGVETLSISNVDKLEHFIAYFVLGLSWFVANKKNKLLAKWKIFICLVAYGAFLEILQATMTSYRAGDIVDLGANSLGVLTAYLLFDKIQVKMVDILWG